MARQRLWQISGHLDYYRDNMYIFRKGGEGYVLKPMNCPFHIQIYKSKPRSYKELPVRYAEWGTVYRYERSGTLQGLLRVRGFTQDDAHIFCTQEQVEDEILRLLDFVKHMLERFGFKEYKFYLSTKDPKQPEKYMGSETEWNKAEEALAQALKKKEIPYREVKGEAVFYGPKIDLNIVDASGREWQCTTIQFDFNLPKRFGLTYVGPDGKDHEVVMLHRALFGAVERFFAILLEHCNGNLPAWLAPTQVAVLPIGCNYLQYAQKVNRELLARGVRSEVDSSTSTVSYKIRNAEVRKIPYIALCGRRETETGEIAVRKHGLGNLGHMTTEELAKTITENETEGAESIASKRF